MKKVIVFLIIIIIILLGVIGTLLFFDIDTSNTKSNEIETIVDSENIDESEDIIREYTRNENNLPIDDEGLLTDENYPSQVIDGTATYYKSLKVSNEYMTVSYDACSGQVLLHTKKNSTYNTKENDYYIIGLGDTEEVVDIQFLYKDENSEYVSAIYLLTRAGKLYKVSTSSIGSNENITAKLADSGIYRIDTRIVDDSKKFYQETVLFVIKSDGTFYTITK